MLVYLASVGVPEIWSCIPTLRALAASDTRGVHQLVDDPGAADVILFSECHLINDDWSLREIRRHPLRRLFPDKCYVYNERDNPWCILPGLYASYPAHRAPRRLVQPTPYCIIREPLTAERRATEPDLLFSFVSAPTNLVRNAIYALDHPSSLLHRSDGFIAWEPGSKDFVARKELFAESLERSHFVLCPRGAGTSSYRLFETMAAGRAPVLIADDWIAPIGPDWDAFSIRWPEAKVHELPAHLERRQHESAAMGAAAREAFETWYSQQTLFHAMMESLKVLVDANTGSEFPMRRHVDRRCIEVAASSLRVWQGRRRRELLHTLRRR
jgi:hypothetical protein